MSKTYCKGSYTKIVDGVPTCQKALSVFYASLKKSGKDYKKAPTEEAIQMLEKQIETDRITDELIEWYIDEFGN